ncbi:response regulator transcription factor [Wukongibacter sp. M2B1]|uniref:response regulator transcription factor n=1 Tax=Wukongibacter sp. M2B1 TaxID=3088895 RepID=UPI003D79CD31
MNKNVLIVEDEERMREITADYFRASGFSIFEARNGREALEILKCENINVVILDIMIPEIDGWTVCRRIRNDSDIPVIILTARSDENDKLMGYELGADDYVNKPFNPKVLVAKTKNLLMRTEGCLGNTNKNYDIYKNGIKINKKSRVVRLDGERLDLTPKEYDLLVYMIENERITLSRDNILDNVWSYDYFGDLRVVDTHIKKLRKKLKNKSSYIHTVIGVGYKFEVV